MKDTIAKIEQWAADRNQQEEVVHLYSVAAGLVPVE